MSGLVKHPSANSHQNRPSKNQFREFFDLHSYSTKILISGTRDLRTIFFLTANGIFIFRGRKSNLDLRMIMGFVSLFGWR